MQSAHLRPGSTIVVMDDRVVQDRIFTEISMVAMEALVLVQPDRAQGGTDRPSTRREDCAHQQDLGILPDAL